MLFFRKIQKYVSVGLLFALLIVMYNNISNQHSHILPDGQIVVHAHPFSKSEGDNPQKKHSHTVNQLFAIAQINNLFSLLVIVSFIFRFIREKFRKNVISFNLGLLISVPELNYQLRAPPLN